MWFWRNCIPTVVGLIMVLCASAVTADTRIALVIGNARYENATALANPINDARAVAEKLGGIGFDVSLHEDLDGQSFRVALGEFTEKALTADLVVVFYAGHAIEIAGQNYLIPVDAQMRSESTAQFETITLEQVLGAAREAGTLGMVMLDACRNNPFATTMQRKNGTRALDRGLAPVSLDGESGLLISFAAEAGNTAADGEAEHSPYTAALLEVLDQPGLEVGRMFRSVRAKVKAATGGAQVPIEQMQLPDQDIFLVAGNASPSDVAPVNDGTVSVTPTVTDPMVVYLSAIRSGDPRQIEAFLAANPNHEMANDARRILLDFADDELWETTIARDTERDYRTYLMAFPAGRHLEEATARLESFGPAAQPDAQVLDPPLQPAFQIFGNLDFQGGDLTADGYRGITLDQCQAQCSADSACVAFTYVQPKEWCWTKGSVGPRQASAGMVSGLKTFNAVQEPVVQPDVAARPVIKPNPPGGKAFTLYADIDFSGFDITGNGIRNISLDGCQDWCRNSGQCTAFTYVEDQSWCWPKSEVGTSSIVEGVVSGRLD